MQIIAEEEVRSKEEEEDDVDYEELFEKIKVIFKENVEDEGENEEIREVIFITENNSYVIRFDKDEN